MKTLYYTPPTGVDGSAPFFEQFELDVNERRTTNVGYLDADGNGKSVNQYRTLLQLTFQRRYARTYAEIRMKPTRHWKITDLKKYYGVKGNALKVADQLDAIYESITEALKKA
jgi:hypothetical protein